MRYDYRIIIFSFNKIVHVLSRHTTSVAMQFLTIAFVSDSKPRGNNKW